MNSAPLKGYTEEEVVKLLDDKCRDAGGVYKFAKQNKLLASHCYELLAGTNKNRRPGPKLLAALDLEWRIVRRSDK